MCCKTSKSWGIFTIVIVIILLVASTIVNAFRLITALTGWDYTSASVSLFFTALVATIGLAAGASKNQKVILTYVFLLFFFVLWQFVSLLVTESQFNNFDLAREWCKFYGAKDDNTCNTVRRFTYIGTAFTGILGLIVLMLINFSSLAFYRSVRQDIVKKHEEALRNATTAENDQQSESED